MWQKKKRGTKEENRGKIKEDRETNREQKEN